MRVSVHAGGIALTLVHERMTRSVLVEAPDAASAVAALHEIEKAKAHYKEVAARTSRYVQLEEIHAQCCANCSIFVSPFLRAMRRDIICARKLQKRF